MIIPPQLSANCQKSPERQAWLRNVPVLVEGLRERWSLRIGRPFEQSGNCSWVAPVTRHDGTSAVLKLGMPHMEGRDEIEGLRFWNGDPTVKLFEADNQQWVMLLERCVPGTVLRSEQESTQDAIITTLLKRLWRTSTGKGLSRFRHLSALVDLWTLGTFAQRHSWPDSGLVQEGLRVMNHLAHPLQTDILFLRIYMPATCLNLSGNLG